MTGLRRSFYTRAWVARDGFVGTQDGGVAPSTSLINAGHGITGWATGDASDAFSTMLFQATQTVFTASHVAAAPEGLNAWRTPKPLSGPLAGGNYDFSARVCAIQGTGTISGKMHFNLWRGRSASGAGATRVNGPDIVGSTCSSLAVSTPQVSVAQNAIAGLTLDNEYLFVVPEWEATSHGVAGDGVQLLLGGLTFFQTSHFTLLDPVPVPEYLEVDWSGHGFDSNLDPDVNAYQDISGYARNASTSRGLTFDAQAIPKSEIGRLTAPLNNPDGIFARKNPASPLYGFLRSKLALRARITAPIDRSFFTGQVDTIVPGSSTSEIPYATLTGYTDFIEFTDNSKVTPVIVAGDTTDVAYGAVLDQVIIRGVTGWPSGKRRIATGDVTIGVIAPVDESPESIIDRINQNELGKVYPGANGDFVAENRNYRRDTLRCQVAQLTFSDDPNAAPPSSYFANIKLESPARLRFDRMVVDFTPSFELDTEPAVFFGVAQDGLGEAGGIHIQPGKSRTFTINPFTFPYLYPIGPGTAQTQAGSGPDAPGTYIVTEWEPLTTTATLPALPSINITNDPGVLAPASAASVSAVKTTPHSITFTVTNSDPALVMEIYEILLSGQRAVVGAPVKQVAGTGTHEYPLPGKDYPDSASSLLAARWLYDYLSPERDWITLTIPCQGNPDLLAALMDLEISSRIRGIGTAARTGLGMDQEFFVENIKWGVQAPGQFAAIILASGCLPNTQDTVTVETGLPTGLSIYYGMNESSGAVKDFLSTHYDLDRVGTSVMVGVIGPGQQFNEVQGDQLVNAGSGLPDTHLTNDWEWNGFVNPSSHSGADQIIVQKGIGDPGSYALLLTSLGGNSFVQGMVFTSDGEFRTTLNGLPLTIGSWHFVRLVHDSVGKRLGVSQDGAALIWVTYTGTIEVVSNGVIFGSSGTLATGSFEYWFRATDITVADGSYVDTFPDRSGNGRDATGRVGSDVKIVYAQMNGLRVVRFNHGQLRYPEISLGPVQIFVLAKIESSAFQGTILRTSATAGPNYGLALSDNFGTYELNVHFYTDNNNNSVKRKVVVSAPPIDYALYTITDDGTGGALTLSINGVPQTLVPSTSGWSGASGMDPDAHDVVDIFEVIIAQSLDSAGVTAVENALLYEAGLGGSPGSSKALNGGLDEFGFWAERYLTEQEASDRYLNGAGSTVTGPGGNSVSPSGPSSTPTTIPSGGSGTQPAGAGSGQLFFNTDLFGGTLQQFMSGSWANIAPGLLQDIPRALIDAKGDLIVGSADNTPIRLGVGTNGQVLLADSGASGGLGWGDIPPSGIPESIIDAKGDLIVGAAADTAARLPVGTDGQVLTALAGATEGVVWAAPPTPGQYQALVYTSDGTDFDFLADGDGEPIYVLRDLE